MKRMILVTTLVAASLPWLDGCVERTVYVQQPPPGQGQPGETVVTEAPPALCGLVVVAGHWAGYRGVPGRWAYNVTCARVCVGWRGWAHPRSSRKNSSNWACIGARIP